jgi:hypothetical protein
VLETNQKERGKIMMNKEKQWVEKVVMEYKSLKRQFEEFKKAFKEFKAPEELPCSIETSEDQNELKILTPFDTTILVRFSVITFFNEPSRGKLTFEKLAKDKEKRNKPFWELYFDGKGNFYKELQDQEGWNGGKDPMATYFTLLKKFIDKYLIFKKPEKGEKVI